MASLVLRQVAKADDICLDSYIKCIIFHLVFLNHYPLLFDIQSQRSSDIMII